MDIFKKLRKAQSDYAAATKGLGAELKELLKSLIAQFPELEAITWTQYTPGFNDGDPCYFRLGEVYVAFKGLNAGDDKDEDKWNARLEEVFGSTDYGYDTEAYVDGKELYLWGAYCKNQTLNKALEDLDKELRNAKSLLESEFGDGVQVFVLSSGKVVVEYYDCGY